MRVRIHRYDQPPVSTFPIGVLVFAALCGGAYSLMSVVANAFSKATDPTMALIIILALLVVAVGAWIAFVIHRNRIYWNDLRERMIQASDGKLAVYQVDDKGGRGGAVLGMSEDTLFAFDTRKPGRGILELPVSRIRDYSWELPGYDKHLSPSLMAMAATSAGKHEAAANSGLFLDIADVNVPHWHVQTQNVAMLRKWFEKLNQAVESGTQGSAPNAGAEPAVLTH